MNVAALVEFKVPVVSYVTIWVYSEIERDKNGRKIDNGRSEIARMVRSCVPVGDIKKIYSPVEHNFGQKVQVTVNSERHLSMDTRNLMPRIFCDAVASVTEKNVQCYWKVPFPSTLPTFHIDSILSRFGTIAELKWVPDKIKPLDWCFVRYFESVGRRVDYAGLFDCAAHRFTNMFRPGGDAFPMTESEANILAKGLGSGVAQELSNGREWFVWVMSDRQAGELADGKMVAGRWEEAGTVWVRGGVWEGFEEKHDRAVMNVGHANFEDAHPSVPPYDPTQPKRFPNLPIKNLLDPYFHYVPTRFLEPVGAASPITQASMASRLYAPMDVDDTFQTPAAQAAGLFGRLGWTNGAGTPMAGIREWARGLRSGGRRRRQRTDGSVDMDATPEMRELGVFDTPIAGEGEGLRGQPALRGRVLQFGGPIGQ